MNACMTLCLSSCGQHTRGRGCGTSGVMHHTRCAHACIASMHARRHRAREAQACVRVWACTHARRWHPMRTLCHPSHTCTYAQHFTTYRATLTACMQSLPVRALCASTQLRSPYRACAEEGGGAARLQAHTCAARPAVCSSTCCPAPAPSCLQARHARPTRAVLAPAGVPDAGRPLGGNLHRVGKPVLNSAHRSASCFALLCRASCCCRAAAGQRQQVFGHLSMWCATCHHLTLW